MCVTCGCSGTPHTHTHEHSHSSSHDHGGGEHHDHGREVEIKASILSFNDRLAEQNRGFFKAKGLLALNLLSGPGSGKTALIEATYDALRDELPLGVVVGDLETENDAERIRRRGAPAVQITTGEVCHLDAQMVQHALEQLPLDGVRLLFIENVGNLVCPASFDLGESARVVLLASTEGEDKPLKYPVMFGRADLVLLSKIDLAEAVEFNRELARDNIRKVAPRAEILEVSAKTGEGMKAWLDWLRARA